MKGVVWAVQTFKKVYIGNRVKALVVAVNKNEAVVDLGTKHSGYIPASELSQDPNADPSDVVKVGDEIEAIVTAVNDAEGTVTLSKKKVDRRVFPRTASLKSFSRRQFLSRLSK